MEEWKLIQGFEEYVVSNSGVICREATGRPLRYVENRYGVVTVGLMKLGVQRRRSVSLIVANAYLPRTNPAFDTPICMDGDRWNNRVSNLVWRPRWFAVLYNRQFREPYEQPIRRKIRDVNSGAEFADSFEVAKWYGLLERDVVLSILNRTVTWPTYQTFEVISD